MEILRRKMWKLAAEEADEGLILKLLASNGNEASFDQLFAYLGLVSPSLTLSRLMRGQLLNRGLVTESYRKCKANEWEGFWRKLTSSWQ